VKEIVFSRRFERDFRRLKRTLPRRSLDYDTLEYVFLLLQSGATLPEAYREHALSGEYAATASSFTAPEPIASSSGHRSRMVK
jgi:mRNA-degrading endonuclease YafQ of YafQ-DinJ toxin-antitoxin module